MSLIMADSMIGMLKNYRVLWINGRYGGGKTALAHKLGQELLDSGFSRYLVSNVRSVWRDNPEKVVLRDGLLADCCVILDEGGLFLKTGHDADQFLAFMRKMNIVLIIPSVMPPAARVRFLTAQRIMTLNTVGLPLWLYKMTLRYGSVTEELKFGWWRPSEIFGIYDTAGAPDDDGGLDEYVKRWTAEIKKTTGYKSKYARQGDEGALGQISGFSDVGASENGGGSGGAELSAVENQRRQFESFAESAEEISSALSIFGQSVNRKRRR